MQPLAENLQELFDHCGGDMAHAIEKRLRPLYLHGKDAAPDLDILQRNRTEKQRPNLRLALAAAREERPQLVPRIQRQIENGFRFYPAQVKAIGETVAMLRHHKAGFMVADCGAGKTAMGAAAIHLTMERRRNRPRYRRKDAPYRVLVMCPNHLVSKWQREAEWLVPNCTAIIVRTFPEVSMLHRPFRQRRIRELRATEGVAAKRRLTKALALADALKHRNLYVIMSKDTAKLGHDVALPCAVPRFDKDHPPDPRDGKWAACPNCGDLLVCK